MTNHFNAERQNKLAEQFYSLHHTKEMLVLANAWDSASARIFQECGFPAIATTSSGVSWACGFQDGEHIPPGLMVDMTARIAGAVTIPVSADIETGYYRNDLHEFSRFISDILEAGAVGVNIEDANSKTKKLFPLKDQIAVLKVAREVAVRKGINLFINARTDAIEHAPGSQEKKIKTCIERARAFEEAGADGIFIPFIQEMETVEKLKEAIRLPLNILINDKLDIARLRQIKVNRITVGGKPMLAALNLLKKIGEDLRSGNDWHSLFVGSPTYPEVNSWFKK